MKCKIYFILVKQAHRNKLNAEGWSSDIGRAYMDATAPGERDHEAALRLNLFDLAAEIDVPLKDGAADLDYVWHTMQNLDLPWTVKHDAITDFPRSAMVGDIIVPEEGAPVVISSFGFTPLSAAEIAAFEEFVQVHDPDSIKATL